MAEQGLSWPISPQKRWRFHLVRGARCLEVGDLSGARRHFAVAYHEAPGEPIVCLAWGREQLRAGEIRAAEALLRQAWRLDPDLVSAGLSLARVLGLHLGRLADAHALLDEIEHTHGVGITSLLVRAEILLNEPDRFDEAKELFKQAAAHGADPEVVRIGLAKAFNAEGVFRSQGGDHHQALFALKRAADLDPTWSGPLVNSGAIFERLGLGAKARDHFREALRLDPVDPVALYNLAANLQRSGAYGEAARQLRRLLSLDPDYPGAREALCQANRVGRLSRPRSAPGSSDDQER